MHQYRFVVYGPNREWSEVQDSGFQNPLDAAKALVVVKKIVHDLYMDGSGELDWEVFELKEVLSGTVNY